MKASSVQNLVPPADFDKVMLLPRDRFSLVGTFRYDMVYSISGVAVEGCCCKRDLMLLTSGSKSPFR
jgi:hypothetical protein